MRSIDLPVLGAKVQAKNRANALLRERAPLLLRRLQPFIGHKVLNLGAVVGRRVRDAAQLVLAQSLPEIQLTLRGSRHALSLHARVQQAVPGKEYTVYGENWINVGVIAKDGATLHCLMSVPKRELADRTVEEIVALLRHREICQKRLDEIGEKLGEFGDRNGWYE